MNISLKNYCNYLCDVLTFRNYIEVPENKADYFTISEEELKNGVLHSSEDISNLLKAWAGDIKRVQNGVDVILIPKVVSDIIPAFTTTRVKKEGQMWNYKAVSLLYIKATIVKTKTGYIIKAKEGESLVWSDPIIGRTMGRVEVLIRELLNKIFGKEPQRDYPKFRLKDGFPLRCSIESWQQYIDAVDRHFKTRTGVSLFGSDTLIDEEKIAHSLYLEEARGQVVVMKDNTVFAVRNIVNLLTYIDSHSELRLPLLNTMVLGVKERKRVYTHSPGECIGKHLGQMKNEYPLADAQREAVHCFSTKIEDGDVLAVSGPPGTGKTTMLQSIVADMIVNYIVNRRKEGAPLILACSSNNKAITNIIDAFRSEDGNTSDVDLHHRWIFYETADKRTKSVPMAVYCPSASASQRNVKDYFLTDRKGGMDHNSLRERYKTNPSDFCSRATRALELGEKCSIDTIAKELRERIGKHQRELNEIEKMIKRKASSCEALTRVANHYKIELEQINTHPRSEFAKEIDRKLDMTLRFDLYWLAVHYNECIWIKKIQEERDQQDVSGKEVWEEIKYICPCVVSTFYMAPKLFEKNIRVREFGYNINLADLLIVDEAGQVSPEVGLPTFALAKKALVVGDVKQIPPVYSISEIAENRYWRERIGAYRSRKDHQLLSCCSSSIMAIAELRCKYERITRSGERKSGLFLNEHRRCIDDIIEYSNKLIYNDELKPKRGSHPDEWSLNDFHPIGYYNVSGQSEMKDGSRYNSGEVEAISSWLEQNAGKIEAAYNKKIEELVCIITPFKAQAMLFKADKELWKFQSGTVHTFQGAEYPIVIFSLVYGASDNPTFIKNNHELMNVAVSRAKDHFIIFGDWSCLEKQSDKACRLLYDNARPIKGHSS